MAAESCFPRDPFFEPPRDKHHELTYTWTIENLSFWAKSSSEYLETDIFRPRLIDEGYWQMRLYPRGGGEPALWYLERVCGDKSDTAQLSFSIRIYSKQVLHYQYQADDHIFKKGAGAACSTDKVLRDMVSQASVHRNQDVLKVVCKMWRRCPTVALSEKLASCTRIEIGRLAFSWHFQQFSSWDPVEHHTYAGYTYGNAVHDMLSCKIQLYSNRDPKSERLGVIIRFRRPPTDDFLTAARISVLNKDGKAVVSYEETVFEKAGDDLIVWVVPVFIDKRMLVEGSSEYLPYNELTLLTEFNIPVKNIYFVRSQYSIASGAAQQNLENNWNREAISACQKSVSTQTSDNGKAQTDSEMQTDDVSEPEQEPALGCLDVWQQADSTVVDEGNMVKVDKRSFLRLLDQLDSLASLEIQKAIEKVANVRYHDNTDFVQKTTDDYDSENSEKSSNSGSYSDDEDSEESDDSGSDCEEDEESNRSEDSGKQLDNLKPTMNHNCHQKDEESLESGNLKKEYVNEVNNPKLKMETSFRQKEASHPSTANNNLEKVVVEEKSILKASATEDESGSSEEGSNSEDSDCSYDGSSSEDSDSSDEPASPPDVPKESPAHQEVESHDSKNSSTDADTGSQDATRSSAGDAETPSDHDDRESRASEFRRRCRVSIEQHLKSVPERITRQWRRSQSDEFALCRFFVTLFLGIALLAYQGTFTLPPAHRQEIPRVLVLFYADTLGDPHLPDLVWSYSTAPGMDARIQEGLKVASTLSRENAWVVLSLAVAHHDRVLRRTALQFLEAHREDTLASLEWRREVEAKMDSAHEHFQKRFPNALPKTRLPSPPQVDG